MSRRWPGPSATTTLAAPARSIACAAPATSSGWVLITRSAAYSTRFGLSSTRLPRTSTFSSASPRETASERSSSYRAAGSSATGDSAGWTNRAGS